MGDAAPNIEKTRIAGNMKLKCIFEDREAVVQVYPSGVGGSGCVISASQLIFDSWS